MEQGRAHKEAGLIGDLRTLTSERRQDALQGIKNGSVQFNQLPAELRDDAEIALAAILKYYPSRDYWIFVSARLKNEREFVLKAVKASGWLLENVSEEMRGDREIVLAAVRQNGAFLAFALAEMCADREIVLAAAQSYGWALKHASVELQSDREVLLEVVRHCGRALAFASKELCADPDVVGAAVRQDSGALKYASEELRGNRKLVLAAVRQNGSVLEYASEELRGDRDIVLEAVRTCGKALQYASDELRADRDIVLVAVRQNGNSLEDASEDLRGDKEIVLAAVRKYYGAFQFALEELRSDRDIVLVALDNAESRFMVLPYVSRDLQDKDPTVAATIIRIGGHLRRGSGIVKRLDNLLLAVSTLPEALVNVVNDEESVLELCCWWEHCIWHKIWLALELEPSGMQGTGRLLVEQSGLPAELQQAKELRYCAPVIGAVLAFSLDWRDLNSYPIWDDDSDDSYSAGSFSDESYSAGSYSGEESYSGHNWADIRFDY